MEEIWKPIECYEGLYEVSNLGRVRSLDRYLSSGHFVRGKIMKPRLQKTGYMLIGLTKNHKQKFFLLHRIVANAFIPNPLNLKCVNHKDEEKTNNVVNNLEWCDHKYNNNYGSRNERLANSIRKNPKTNCKKVIQYTLDGDFINCYPSLSTIERSFGFYHSLIKNCCIGKCKSAYGYIWEYAS